MNFLCNFFVINRKIQLILPFILSGPRSKEYCFLVNLRSGSSTQYLYFLRKLVKYIYWTFCSGFDCFLLSLVAIVCLLLYVKKTFMNTTPFKTHYQLLQMIKNFFKCISTKYRESLSLRSQCILLLFVSTGIYCAERDKIFKNEPSEICGRKPLKNLKLYGVLKQIIPI